MTEIKKVLILDDLPDICRLIKLILERDSRLDIAIFTTGAGALEYTRNNHVDLAIIDIKLSQMNGIEVFRQMKTILPDVKAIILTGYPTIETAREAIKLGVSDYCVKPVEKNMLVKSVNRLLFSST